MKVYKYGDNVDTDVIIPARYLNAPDEKSLASHCMEDIDAGFASTVEPGDIIVAGANFGCGSSRWTNRYSCLQMTRCIELFTSFRSEDTSIFTCRQYFRQNIFQFPVIFFRSNQFVELSHHFSRIVVSSWIYRKHT